MLLIYWFLIDSLASLGPEILCEIPFYPEEISNISFRLLPHAVLKYSKNFESCTLMELYLLSSPRQQRFHSNFQKFAAHIPSLLCCSRTQQMSCWRNWSCVSISLKLCSLIFIIQTGKFQLRRRINYVGRNRLSDNAELILTNIYPVKSVSLSERNERRVEGRQSRQQINLNAIVSPALGSNSLLLNSQYLHSWLAPGTQNSPLSPLKGNEKLTDAKQTSFSNYSHLSTVSCSVINDFSFPLHLRAMCFRKKGKKQNEEEG